MREQRTTLQSYYQVSIGTPSHDMFAGQPDGKPPKVNTPPPPNKPWHVVVMSALSPYAMITIFNSIMRKVDFQGHMHAFIIREQKNSKKASRFGFSGTRRAP